MAFDFSSLGSANSADTVLEPREIFTVLTNKDPKYQYPRDVQAEVWTRWFERRNEKDIVVRMNTGSGKTVVGLLILKSCLNEEKGPAVYVAPDQYLVKQVLDEASELGIEVTDSKDAPRFLRGKAILVTTIRTLVNGRSVFGVGDAGIRIEIGSVLIDDAHACLETTESQFTLKLDGGAHTKLLALFRDDLAQQSEPALVELEQARPGRNMLVPYWAWINKSSEVISILNEVTLPIKNGVDDPYTQQERDGLGFNYPLIKEVLKHCRCVFGEGEAEISPRVLPISVIPSFAEARRRIVMSATLGDDGILISHFDLNPNALTQAITPQTANDIGDRLILVPQAINPEITDEMLKAMLKEFAKKKNVVVIVPSNFRANFWGDVANETLRAENIEAGVERLKAGHVGLVVLVNKYDGIDLPKSACEILAIDGLPDVRRAIDKIEEGILFGSPQVLGQRIQRIEQGMGRGIRANDDHCLVLLIGKTLTNFLFKMDAPKRFSAATRAQLNLSEQVCNELYGKPIDAMKQAAELFLNRDKKWIAASKSALVHIKYEQATSSNVITLKQREAFASASRNDPAAAVRALTEAVNQTSDNKIKGWLKQQVAEYQHQISPPESQVTLRSAIALNPRLTRPMAGIDYKRLNPTAVNQAAQCAEYLRRYEDGNRLIVEVNSYLDQLVFREGTSEQFEEVMREVGAFIGFRTQRPEKEFGRGPDVLWEVGERAYFVIECKNGVTSTNPINKHDVNQLNGSMVWFSEKYDTSCSAIPFMIHPQTEIEHAASLHAGTRVITAETLELLREAIRKFATAASAANRTNVDEIRAILNQFLLTQAGLLKFTVPSGKRKK